MTDHNDLLERLVRTETLIDQYAERTQAQHQAILDGIQDVRASMEKTEQAHDDRLKALEESLQRYKGAWGAVTLIASAVVVAYQIFETWIRKRVLGE